MQETFYVEKMYLHDNSKKIFGLYLLTIWRPQNISSLIMPRYNEKNSLAFSHWL
jgi:hypothetical protein